MTVLVSHTINLALPALVHVNTFIRLSIAEEEVKKRSKAVMADVASANKELRSATEEAKKDELVRASGVGPSNGQWKEEKHG